MKKRICYIGEDGYCHVPLQNGKEAICNIEVAEEVGKHTWSASRYPVTKAGKNTYKTISLHRFVFQISFPEIDIKNKELDHKNRNRYDCRIENIRIADRSKNMANRRKIKEGCSSNYKGVSKTNNKFCVVFSKKNFGTFDSEVKAAEVYDRLALSKYKEFAVLNFESKKDEYLRMPTPKPINRVKKYSLLRGVTKDGNIFITQVCIGNGRSITIGRFIDELSAGKAYDLYIIKNNLNKKLNFPIETYQQELNQESKQMVLFKTS